jgi:hypothetical protein
VPRGPVAAKPRQIGSQFAAALPENNTVRFTFNQIGGGLAPFGGPDIGSLDPLLATVWTAYPAEPLLALFDPPVERAGG